MRILTQKRVLAAAATLRHPQPGHCGRISVDKMVHFPRLSPLTALLYECKQPLVLTSFSFCQFHHGVRRIHLGVVPEHVHDALAAMVAPHFERVCKNRSLLYWRQLPQICEDRQVGSAPRPHFSSGLSTAWSYFIGLWHFSSSGAYVRLHAS